MTGRNSTVTRHSPTFDECMDAAAEVLIRAVSIRAAMTPREAAEAAWYPGHPLITVEALEAHITERRARQQVRPAKSPGRRSAA